PRTLPRPDARGIRRRSPCRRRSSSAPACSSGDRISSFRAGRRIRSFWASGGRARRPPAPRALPPRARPLRPARGRPENRPRSARLRRGPSPARNRLRRERRDAAMRPLRSRPPARSRALPGPTAARRRTDRTHACCSFSGRSGLDAGKPIGGLATSNPPVPGREYSTGRMLRSLRTGGYLSEIQVDGDTLTIEDVGSVARLGAAPRLAPRARRAMARSRALVERTLRTGTVAYGVNTGFGHLADVHIAPADL